MKEDIEEILRLHKDIRPTAFYIWATAVLLLLSCVFTACIELELDHFVESCPKSISCLFRHDYRPLTGILRNINFAVLEKMSSFAS